MDMLDTIYSHMIAERDNTWVMTDENGKHKKRYYEKDYAREICHAYNKVIFYIMNMLKNFQKTLTYHLSI